MELKNFLFSFLLGGMITALIVGLEASHMRTWSGVAALMPVFTMVSYFFIGASQNAIAVSQHAKFVLVGTLVSWVPYMAVIAWTAPRLGTNRSIILSLTVFFILAGAYVYAVEKLRLFK
jgi:uncharacterized membrane protein (GlpM family)